MSRTATAIAAIQKTATTHGIKLPKKLADALERERKREHLYSQYKPTGIDLRTAITDALEAGNDPAHDSNVIAATVEAHILANPDYDDRDRAKATLSPHYDAIIDAFKPAFDRAAEHIVKAHKILTNDGHESLTDTSLVTGTPEAHEAAGHARTAHKTISDIVGLGTLIEGASVHGGKTWPWLTYVDPASVPYEVLQPYRQKGLNIWDAAGLGTTLSLANPTEYRARIRAFKQAGEEERQRREAANLEAWKRNSVGAYHAT